ncbi:P-loop containing nucleoside triphosphate hydrolase, partial [Trinorchestia longiramus]
NKESRNISQPLAVLVVSSTPRSGSSFLGELLTTENTAVYFFEPFHKVRLEPEMKDDFFIVNYLKDKFTCNIDHEFNAWLHEKEFFLAYFNEESHHCANIDNIAEQTACLAAVNIKEECEKSKNRVVKVIRVRLRSIVRLLTEPDLDVRVVHLVRDPRGFRSSLSKFGEDWNKNLTKLCSELNADLESFELLSKVFPNKLVQVNYEQFASDPEAGTKRLFKSIYGHDLLPLATKIYLESHTKIQISDSMSTNKESTKVYEAWRDSISESLLQAVENDPDCRISIQRMNHTLFGSLETTRNKTISLFL